MKQFTRTACVLIGTGCSRLKAETRASVVYGAIMNVHGLKEKELEGFPLSGEERTALLHGTQTVGENGHLFIGGVDTADLAAKFGTPLYVYDSALIKSQIRAFKDAFIESGAAAWQIAYASKAFSTVAMIQLIGDCGLALDVVSGGELYTALKAGFPARHIHFHGNNKSREELEQALEAKIGTIIVDNFHELELIERLCERRGQKIEILLRVTPGVEAHTHEYIMTGHDDTKFGFNLDDGTADQAIRRAQSADHLIVKGLHFHIGSQIFTADGFLQSVHNVFKRTDLWKKQSGFWPDVLNVGGGFGISYTEADRPLPVGICIGKIVDAVKKECAERAMPVPAVWVEPGRSIVGEAGTTLYTAGSTKNVSGKRKYVAVDGGMSDNIRPALYHAQYEAIAASQAGELTDETVTIAGKLCESGDVLVRNARLPKTLKSGDLIAVLCTGAYGYSMASHYNRIPNPPVVFVEDGEATLVVRGETLDDLVRLDMPLKSLSGQGHN